MNRKHPGLGSYDEESFRGSKPGQRRRIGRRRTLQGKMGM